MGFLERSGDLSDTDVFAVRNERPHCDHIARVTSAIPKIASTKLVAWTFVVRYRLGGASEEALCRMLLLLADLSRYGVDLSGYRPPRVF